MRILIKENRRRSLAMKWLDDNWGDLSYVKFNDCIGFYGGERRELMFYSSPSGVVERELSGKLTKELNNLFGYDREAASVVITAFIKQKFGL